MNILKTIKYNFSDLKSSSQISAVLILCINTSTMSKFIYPNVGSSIEEDGYFDLQYKELSSSVFIVWFYS